MKEDQVFYVGQKAFIDKDSQILVLNDSLNGELDFPGGKIQEGEFDFSKALKREVREETGLEIEVGDPFCVWHWRLPPYHKNSNRLVFLVGYRCKYVSGEVKLSDEHNGHRWVSVADYREVDDQSDYFGALEKYFNLARK
ncbi:MAG: hypothetical protein A2855_02250 [Candidatus Liptonbacteria bacterium RIFCSPHIGHO2_01_FULL_57_28]|uniref:Nudix hydrolase domain-containing protein n=1 Tax=Candidatus Liptonbacteria bacterium RIFCSPHIGHO2_01_FULL_57_28 TaxID=1798647 RepID=A0A1G2C920_9BACT|nr:MAG: hypothetical protein A2855_02250 [Candidatus Liptonbacteria bacterium RIFCSPHIGHO2_01_FULL_57_28]